MYDDLLFPTDGGDGAETGFERALEAARTFDADLPSSTSPTPPATR